MPLTTPVLSLSVTSAMSNEAGCQTKHPRASLRSSSEPQRQQHSPRMDFLFFDALVDLSHVTFPADGLQAGFVSY